MKNMKKNEKLLNDLVLWITRGFQRLIKQEDVKINDNLGQIKSLMTESNYIQLTIEQQFDLKKAVDIWFDELMLSKKEQAKQDLLIIENKGNPKDFDQKILEINTNFQDVEFVNK